MARLYTYLMTLLLLSAIAGDALGQGTTFCLELARRGLFDKYAGKSFTSSYSESQAEYCRKFNESKKSNSSLFAAYSGGLLDFRQSDNRQTAEFVCSSNFNADSFLQSSSSVASVLSPQAVEAIRACANTSGLRVNGSFPTEDTLSLEVAYIPMTGEQGEKGKAASRTFTDAYGRNGAVVCEGPLSKVKKGDQLNNNALAMTCTRRDSAATTVQGLYGPVKVTPGGLVTVYTSDKTINVPLPAKIEAPSCAPQPVQLTNPVLNNLCVGCLGYAGLITDNDPSPGGINKTRSATYTVTVPNCGDYQVVASYETLASRPVTLSVDGKVISTNVMPLVRGTHTVPTNVAEAVLPLRAGQHVFSFSRQGPYPHVHSITLMPWP